METPNGEPHEYGRHILGTEQGLYVPNKFLGFPVWGSHFIPFELILTRFLQGIPRISYEPHISAGSPVYAMDLETPGVTRAEGLLAGSGSTGWGVRMRSLPGLSKRCVAMLQLSEANVHASMCDRLI